MNDLYLKYFANVRWVELLLSVGVAVLGDLQVTIGTGGKVDKESLLKAAGVGLAVGWAYLRVPKAPVSSPRLPSSASLPDGVDDTGPADDVEPSVLESAIAAALPPGVGAVVPDLAGNIAKEVGRVLRRGIRL